MKAIGRLAILVLAPGGFLIAAIADCGGKTAADSTTDIDTGLGGNSGLGGNAGATGLAPRVPAVHRAQALSCVGVHSPQEPTMTWYSASSTCVQHADCLAGVNGKCIHGIGMMGSTYRCTYDECATDAECDPDMICYCASSDAARCLTIGNCRTDADCGGGSYSYCSPSMSWDCSGYRPIDGYHCHTPADTCMDDADCTGTDYCNFNVYAGKWECTAANTSCAIG